MSSVYGIPVRRNPYEPLYIDDPNGALADELERGYDPKVIKDLFHEKDDELALYLVKRLLKEAAHRQDLDTAYLILAKPLFLTINEGTVEEVEEFLYMTLMTFPLQLFWDAVVMAATIDNERMLPLFLFSDYLNHEAVQRSLPDILGDALLNAVSSGCMAGINHLTDPFWEDLIETQYWKWALHMEGGHKDPAILDAIVRVLSKRQNEEKMKKDQQRAFCTAVTHKREETARHILNLENFEVPIETISDFATTAARIGDKKMGMLIQTLGLYSAIPLEALSELINKISEIIQDQEEDQPYPDKSVTSRLVQTHLAIHIIEKVRAKES
jgi:hypothetical protein